MIHEEVYRGNRILEKIESFRVFVCGCGAIGSNLIDNMARQGFRNITVVDMDRVEDHNRNTQIWGRRDVGQLKTKALVNRIFNDMAIPVLTTSIKVTEDNIDKLLKGLTFIVDGFDNTESRKLVTDYCKVHKIDCLHVGLNAGYAELIWNEQYTVPKKSGTDVCEYPLARNVVLLAVSVATEVIIRYIVKGIKESYTITLGDFKISLMEQ